MNKLPGRKSASLQSLDDQLRFAIANKRLVRVTYDKGSLHDEHLTWDKLFRSCGES